MYSYPVQMNLNRISKLGYPGRYESEKITLVGKNPLIIVVNLESISVIAAFNVVER